MKFYHKKNSEENFTAETLTASPDGTHKVEVDKNLLDSFGMEFYFEARDASKTKLTNKGKIKNSVIQAKIFDERKIYCLIALISHGSRMMCN